MRLRVLVACTVLCAALVASASLSPAADTSDELVQRLARRVGADRVKADHVVLLDLSGSMLYGAEAGVHRRAPVGNRRIDIVRRAVPALLQAVQPGDYFTLIAFDGRPRESAAMLIQSWQGAPSAQAVSRALDGLEPAPQGDTDIGQALRLALQRHLVRTNANPIQFLYLLTDGRHEPTSQNPFPTAFQGEWLSLKKDLEGMSRRPDHAFLSYFFGLYDVEDAGLVREAIPSIEFLAFQGSGDLAQFFTNIAGSHQRMRIKALAFKDLQEGQVDVQSTLDENNRLQVAVHSGYRKLPVKAAVTLPAELNGRELSAKFAGPPPPQELELAPGESKSFTIPLRVEPRRRSGWKKRVAESIEFTAGVGEYPGPPEEFAAAGLASLISPTTRTEPLRIKASASAGGFGLATLLSVLAVTLAGAYAFLCFRPARLYGSLAISRINTTGAVDRYSIPLRGSRMRFGSADTPGVPADSFEVYPGKRWHQTHVCLNPLKPSVRVKVGGRNHTGGTMQVPEAVSISINDVTLRWTR